MTIPQTNMAQKRSGLNPLSYMGVETTTPPQLLVQDRLPTVNDKDNVNIGALWVYNDRTTVPWYPYVYMLTNLYNGRATWTPLGAGTGEVSYILAEDGNYAYPTSDGQISVVGDGVSIETIANPLVPNTVKISYKGTIPAGKFQTSTGTAEADPTTGILKMYGASNIYTYTITSGTPPITDTVITALNDNVVLSGSMKIGTTLEVDSFATHPGILVSDNVGAITTVTPTVDSTCPVYNTGTGLITWQPFSGGGGAGTFQTDAGSVTPDGTGKLKVFGQNCIVTDGGTANTVKVGVSEVAIPVGEAPVIVGMGIGTPSQWGSIKADSGCTLSFAGGVITIHGGGTTPGSGLTDMDVDDGTVHINASNMIKMYGDTNQIVAHAAASDEITLQISPTLSLPGTLTIPAMTTAGVLTNNASGLISSSAGTADGQVLTWTSGAPVWSAGATGSGVTTLKSDSGTATVNLPGKPVGQIQLVGGLNIGTTAGVDTLTVNLDTSILLPFTTADSFNGVIGIGTALITHRFISALGTGNTFIGQGSGVLTGLVTANAKYNTSLGMNTLNALVGTSSGQATRNTALGYNSGGGLTSGSDNTFCGYASGDSMTTPNQNSAFGAYSMSGSVTANDNCAFGYKSMYVSTSAVNDCVFGAEAGVAITSGSDNCLFGKYAAHALTTGNYNVLAGSGVAAALTTGSNNIALGYGTMDVLTTGNNNVCIGTGAGSALATSNSSNVLIKHAGVAGDDYVIRIGTSLNTVTRECYIAGILGNLIAAPSNKQLVYVQRDSAGNDRISSDTSTPATGGVLKQTSTGPAWTAAGTAGQVLITGTTSNPTWASITSTGGSIAITSTGGNINLEQDSTYCFSAYVPVTMSNVTGDGTEYLLGTGSSGIMTELVDDGSNFYVGSGGSGLSAGAYYAAPYTGFYSFCVSIQYAYSIPTPPPSVPVDPIYVKIYTSSGTSPIATYTFDYVLPTTSGTYTLNGQYTVFVKMNAGEKARFSFSANIGSKVVSLGSGIGNSYVSGFLVGKL